MNKANEYKTAQVINVEKMSFNNLKTQKVLVNASLASKLFSSGVILYGAMLECIDTFDVTDGNDAVKNTAGMTKLRESIVTFKDTFTNETVITTLKAFLQKTTPVCEIQPEMIGEDQGTGTGNINSIPEMISTKQSNLPKSTPEYHGRMNKENLFDWLTIVENKFVMANIPDQNKLSSLMEFIKEDAMDWTIHHIGKNGYDWETFKTAIVRKFVPKDQQRLLKKQLKDFKQTGALADFNRKFISLSNRIMDISDITTLEYYIDNINGDVSFQVILAKDMKEKYAGVFTLDDAMEVATTYDTCLQINKKTLSVNHTSNHKKSKPQYAKNITQTKGK